jgi:nitrogenase molybdenum-iron protein NifN
MGSAAATVYLGNFPAESEISRRDCNSPAQTIHDAGDWLNKQCGVPLTRLELPIGIEYSDRFFSALAKISGREIPYEYNKQRGRLIDAYIDGHKYVNGKRAIIYGEEDFVVAICSFLDEIGIFPVIAATGSARGNFTNRIRSALRNARKKAKDAEIMEEADFATMLERAKSLKPDIIIGHSKGLYLSRELGVPLVRCGFPIHDRIGGQRILHVGYRGTLNLFDTICNSLMEAKQNIHSKGYTYI